MDCKEHYKSCGIIDTLNQKLCIREEENCPLYDIVIGRQPYNLKDYIYDKEANIYYNNENYKGNTIIGKLILNDGEPCYYLDDKLWKKFVSYEIGDGHLECKNEIFGKKSDDRYEERGNVEYKRLYEDNNLFARYYILPYIKDERVSLYKRVFLGIDKDCYKKNSMSEKNFSDLIQSQSFFILLLKIEGISLILSISLIFCISLNHQRGCLKENGIASFFLLFYMAQLL